MSETSLDTLGLRIPTPVTEFGQSVLPNETIQRVVYNRERLIELPGFLLEYGGDPRAYREFFQVNEFPPRSLKPGMLVIIPKSKGQSFSTHPEA